MGTEVKRLASSLHMSEKEFIEVVNLMKGRKQKEIVDSLKFTACDGLVKRLLAIFS